MNAQEAKRRTQATLDQYRLTATRDLDKYIATIEGRITAAITRGEWSIVVRPHDLIQHIGSPYFGIALELLLSELRKQGYKMRISEGLATISWV